MKLLGIGDNVLDDYRWRQELYPGGNSVNVPVLARRYDGSTAAYIGVLADDGEYSGNTEDYGFEEIYRVQYPTVQNAKDYDKTYVLYRQEGEVQS